MRERTVFVPHCWICSFYHHNHHCYKEGWEGGTEAGPCSVWEAAGAGRREMWAHFKCGHSLTVQGELFLTTITEPNFYLNSPCFLEETTYSITYASIQLHLPSFQSKVGIFFNLTHSPAHVLVLFGRWSDTASPFPAPPSFPWVGTRGEG